MRSKDENLFREILDCVNTYYDDNGRSPSLREIGSMVGMSYPTVQRYLTVMRDRGEIDYDGHRGIVTEHMNKLLSVNRVSVGGVIACGPLEDAEDYRTEHMYLPKELTGEGSFHLLEASGHSMIGAGIDDGDKVLIRVTPVAHRGDIIACLYDSEKTTLKRYYPEKDEIILKPENDDYETIHIVGADRAKFVIQGVATMVMKKL